MSNESYIRNKRYDKSYSPSFTKSNNFSLMILPQISPGPATYTTRLSIEKNVIPFAGYSKRQNRKYSAIPGVGSYRIERIPKYYSQPSLKKQTQKSLQPKKPNDVGPGQYDISMSLLTDRGPKFVKSDSKSKLITTPSVGQYNIQFKNSSPAYTFIKKNDKKMKSYYNQPGPQTYRTDYRYKNLVTVTLPKSKRPDMNSITPGPGAYNYDSPQTSRILTTRRSSSDLEKIKAVRVKYFIEKGLDVSKNEAQRLIKSKLTLNQLNSALEPSPQTYCLSSRNGDKVMIDFKKAQRKIIFNGGFNYIEKPNLAPGPKYLVNLKKSNKITFTKSQRQKVFRVNDAPGVGAYSYKSDFDKFAQKKSVKSRKVFYENLAKIKFDFNQIDQEQQL